MRPALRELNLHSEVAVVTGAARGIGLEIAATLRDAGATVIGLDLESSIELDNLSEHSYSCDVTNSAALAEIDADLIRQELRPTIVVNNAGITRDAVSWKMSPEDWQAVLQVNLTGAFNVARQWIPAMRAAKHGSIVNITSINGLRGKFGQSNYAAAKAGMIGLTKALAREVGAFGVRVNAVAPGMVETEMTKILPEEVQAKARDEALLPELVTPHDVANAVLFLCSPMARGITGQVLQVDAGQYL